MYRPGVVPRTQPDRARNVQRRPPYLIPTPQGAAAASAIPLPSLESPREEVLVPVLSAADMGRKRTQTGGAGVLFWIGGSVLVFWVLAVTLFFISHVSRPSLVPTETRRTLQFSLLPTQGRFQNVSIPKGVTPVTWHRTCCIQQQHHHCDGSGLFAVHLDLVSSALVVRVIQTDIIGAQCTFHYW